MKLCWFIKYIIENNKKDNNWTLYFIDLLTHSTCNTRRQQVNKYWGLLAKLSTFALLKKKKRRMRILGTVFFLSLLAGKFATFEQMLLTEKNKKIGACLV